MVRAGRRRVGGTRRVAAVLLPLLLVLLIGTASAARPIGEDPLVGGDYSDDAFAAPRAAAAAAAVPAEGAEGSGAGAGAANDPRAAAIAAAVAARGGMRASEVGFAGVRFDESNNNDAAGEQQLLAASPLLRACRRERAEHCAAVRAHRHDGRLFRCLAARAGGLGFGDGCRVALAARVHGRQGNWRLDPRLLRECADDAARLCPREDAREAADAGRDAAAEAAASAGGGGGGGGGDKGAGLSKGDGLRCLARHASSSGAPAAGVLSPRCEAELSRAAHAFLFLWAPGGPLTAPCDRDVGRLCLVADPGLAQTPGAVDACLDGVFARRWRPYEDEEGAGAAADAAASAPPSRRQDDDRRLAPSCAALVRLSAQGRARALKREFSASLALYSAVHASLGALEGATGQALARRDAGGQKIVGLTPAGVGAVVGGSVGGAVVLALVAGAACWGCAAAARRRRRKRGLMAGAGIGAPTLGVDALKQQQQRRVAAVFLQVAPKI
jgi:hypothetical protein